MVMAYPYICVACLTGQHEDCEVHKDTPKDPEAIGGGFCACSHEEKPISEFERELRERDAVSSEASMYEGIEGCSVTLEGDPKGGLTGIAMVHGGSRYWHTSVEHLERHGLRLVVQRVKSRRPLRELPRLFWRRKVLSRWVRWRHRCGEWPWGWRTSQGGDYEYCAFCGPSRRRCAG